MFETLMNRMKNELPGYEWLLRNGGAARTEMGVGEYFAHVLDPRAGYAPDGHYAVSHVVYGDDPLQSLEKAIDAAVAAITPAKRLNIRGRYENRDRCKRMSRDIAMRLRTACLDWDGTQQPDGAEPISIHCAQLREAADAILGYDQRIRAAADDLDQRDANNMHVNDVRELLLGLLE